MFNYPGEYVELPWVIFSTTLGGMFNYPGDYVQLPQRVCSTTWGVCSTTLGSMFNYPREYFQLPWGVFSTTRGHETARGLHVRGGKLCFRREWRRSETQTIDFCNRKLKKQGTYPRIPRILSADCCLGPPVLTRRGSG